MADRQPSANEDEPNVMDLEAVHVIFFDQQISESRDRDMYSLEAPTSVGNSGAQKRSNTTMNGADSQTDSISAGRAGRFTVIRPAKQYMLQFEDDRPRIELEVLQAVDAIFRMPYNAWCNRYLPLLRHADRLVYDGIAKRVWTEVQTILLRWATVIKEELSLAQRLEDFPDLFLRRYADYLRVWSVRSRSLGMHLSWLQASWLDPNAVSFAIPQNSECRLLANSCMVIFDAVVCQNKTIIENLRLAIKNTMDQIFNNRRQDIDISALGLLVQGYRAHHMEDGVADNVTIDLPRPQKTRDATLATLLRERETNEDMHADEISADSRDPPKSPPPESYHVFDHDQLPKAVRECEPLLIISQLSVWHGVKRTRPRFFEGDDGLIDASKILADWMLRYSAWKRAEADLWDRSGIAKAEVSKHLEFSSFAIFGYWIQRMVPLVSLVVLKSLESPLDTVGLDAYVKEALGYNATAQALVSELFKTIGEFTQWLNASETVNESQRWSAAIKVYQGLHVFINNIAPKMSAAFDEEAWIILTSELDKDGKCTGLASYVFSEIDNMLSVSSRSNTNLAWKQMIQSFTGLGKLLEGLGADEEVQERFRYRMASRWLPRSVEDLDRFNDTRELGFINMMARLCGDVFVWNSRSMIDEVRRQIGDRRLISANGDTQVLLLRTHMWPIEAGIALAEKLPSGLEGRIERSAVDGAGIDESMQPQLNPEQSNDQRVPLAERKWSWHLMLSILNVTFGRHIFSCTAAQNEILRVIKESSAPLTIDELHSRLVEQRIDLSSDLLKSALEDAFSCGNGLIVFCQESKQYSLNPDTLGPVVRLNTLRLPASDKFKNFTEL